MLRGEQDVQKIADIWKDLTANSKAQLTVGDSVKENPDEEHGYFRKIN